VTHNAYWLFIYPPAFAMDVDRISSCSSNIIVNAVCCNASIDGC